eukprot:scaffold54797_cov60-Phaeocystis_antarctica.AAC.2
MSAGKTPPPRVSLVQSSLQWICSCSVICSTIAICSSSASKRSSTGALAVLLSGSGPAVRAVYGLGAGLLAITGRRGLPADVACALPACAVPRLPPNFWAVHTRSVSRSCPLGQRPLESELDGGPGGSEASRGREEVSVNGRRGGKKTGHPGSESGSEREFVIAATLESVLLDDGSERGSERAREGPSSSPSLATSAPPPDRAKSGAMRSGARSRAAPSPTAAARAGALTVVAT